MDAPDVLPMHLFLRFILEFKANKFEYILDSLFDI